MTDDLRNYTAPRWFSRLLCALFGHRRGKRMTGPLHIVVGRVAYQCPRCFTTWTRKVKAK